MHESLGAAWVETSQLSGASLHSLKDLNRRFLELAAIGWGDWSCRGGLAGIASRLAPLNAAQREAAANCPYALFDLRFRDAAHWQGRLRQAERWRISDEHAVDAATVDFVRLALFYAWHIASMTGLAAQLQLGMSVATAATFRATTLDSLPSLAVTESKHLTARWDDCAVYWSALVGAASGGNPTALRRVQLHGLQLAAASRLSSYGVVSS
jgi:hypothetical protein